ncbi:MAG: hypothetical protein KatS3mg008_1635 [Acidimicrobiales bacterium]|nr:MAG: hypothetical protein KatS3mg008_1635 [Acidimicrobiales bacterium]
MQVMAETHISLLLEQDDLVFKFKKPVDMGFLDFTTLEARREACMRELELNSRLAPDVYVGVAELSLGGAPCDYAVVMRRMPEERRLSNLVRGRRADLHDCLEAVARRVADFHSRAERGEHISAFATSERQRMLWEANHEVLQRFAGVVLPLDRVSDVLEHAVEYLDGRGELFRLRAERGRVCDGHGDLRAEDVFCLADGPRILDCIEFDDTLRYGDVMADVAFLAMDLEVLGSWDLAKTFLSAYRHWSGDVAPESLVHHYVAYRAQVRCKVSCLRGEQLAGEDRLSEEEAARRYLECAWEHLRRGRVRMVLVGGLPGSGKSTLARALADQTGWVLLSSDEVRREVAPPDPEARYAPDGVAAVYKTLLERAREATATGESVILDASWTSEEFRRQARSVAEGTRTALYEVICEAPLELMKKRVERRALRGSDPSEATPAVVDLLAGRFDPWPQALPIDTSASLDESARSLIRTVAPELSEKSGEPT